MNHETRKHPLVKEALKINNEIESFLNKQKAKMNELLSEWEDVPLEDAERSPAYREICNELHLIESAIHHHQETYYLPY